MKNLTKLEDHNTFIMNKLHSIDFSKENGIECPKCKNELHDVLGVSLLSNPPQTPIFCKNCDFKGTRL